MTSLYPFGLELSIIVVTLCLVVSVSVFGLIPFVITVSTDGVVSTFGVDGVTFWRCFSLFLSCLVILVIDAL